MSDIIEVGNKKYLECEIFIDRDGDIILISRRIIKADDLVVNTTSGCLFRADNESCEFMNNEIQFKKVEATSNLHIEGIKKISAEENTELRKIFNKNSSVHVELVNSIMDLQQLWVNSNNNIESSYNWAVANQSLIGQELKSGLMGGLNIKTIDADSRLLISTVVSDYIGKTPEEFGVVNWSEIKKLMINDLTKILLK